MPAHAHLVVPNEMHNESRTGLSAVYPARFNTQSKVPTQMPRSISCSSIVARQVLPWQSCPPGFVGLPHDPRHRTETILAVAFRPAGIVGPDILAYESPPGPLDRLDNIQKCKLCRWLRQTAPPRRVKRRMDKARLRQALQGFGEIFLGSPWNSASALVDKYRPSGRPARMAQQWSAHPTWLLRIMRIAPGLLNHG